MQNLYARPVRLDTNFKNFFSWNMGILGTATVQVSVQSIMRATEKRRANMSCLWSVRHLTVQWKMEAGCSNPAISRRRGGTRLRLGMPLDQAGAGASGRRHIRSG